MLHVLPTVRSQQTLLWFWNLNKCTVGMYPVLLVVLPNNYDNTVMYIDSWNVIGAPIDCEERSMALRLAARFSPVQYSEVGR